MKIPEKQFSSLIGRVWLETSADIIRSGFKKRGILPFDDKVIPEELYDAEDLRRWKTSQNIVTVRQDVSGQNNVEPPIQMHTYPANKEMEIDRSNCPSTNSDRDIQASCTSQINDIVRKLSTTTNVSGDNNSIYKYPHITRFFHKNYPSAFLFRRLDLDVPDVTSVTEDEDLFEVGLSPGHSRALVLKYSTAYAGVYGTGIDVATALTPQVRYAVASHYINSLLAIVPLNIHEKIIEGLRPFAFSGAVQFTQMSLDEYQAYKDARVSPERLMFCASMVATCFTKHNISVNGLVPKRTTQHLKELNLPHNAIMWMQKAVILGTVNIIRRVLYPH
ncbi:uncharacterized protein LOC123671628 [Harmonia axyridis]|uniref:uncharacterized protein LOC123671628 n=1 Tax=Harmonia axyridis TaxID=115357 RepID=UPI001E27815A|nr:uncharacterized protein LOC123671628 [Harmonia axyridis]